MGALTDRIAEARVGVVPAGGLWWQIVALTSADLLRHGEAMLAMLPAQPIEGEEPPYVGPEQQRTLLSQTRAACIAAVRGVAEQEAGPFEVCRLVGSEEEQDKPAGHVYVEALPPATLIALYGEIVRFGSDDGRLAKALAAFRVGSGPAGDGGSAGEAVREVAP